MAKLTDKSPMPFGRYTGVPMANVPADYLLHLYYEGTVGPQIKEYIEDNLNVLEKEIDEIKSTDLTICEDDDTSY